MNNPKTVGIVGGGQLGRMLTEAAIKLGFKVLVLDPTPNCPATQVGAEQIEGSWKDTGKIDVLIEKSDFVTIEIEHIDTDTLDKYPNKHINPKPSTIRLIQDKYNQKVFLKENNIEVVEFQDAKSWPEVKSKLKNWGGKLFLKSKYDAYDGRGNWFITNPEIIDQHHANEDPKNYYVEKYNQFMAELSVIVAKDMKGNIKSFPTTKTIHKRNICIETITPTEFPNYINKKAQDIAERAVSKLKGSGVFGVEMFLSGFDEILVNEIAPRVHNSGHYTMEACKTSQFEQHIRAITGMDLGSCEIKVKAAAMVNILGEIDGATEVQGIQEAKKIENVSVYMYGKSPSKIDRKMGHINAIGDTIEEARKKALKARSLIKI